MNANPLGLKMTTKAEVKQMIIEHQGYMKGLEACDKTCEEKK